MRLRLRTLIITLTAAGCLVALSAGPASAGTTPGAVSTFAGGGTQVVSTTGTPAKDAYFSAVYGDAPTVAVDAAGDVAIGNYDYNFVYLKPGANCTTTCPFGLTDMQQGDVYVAIGYGSTAPTRSGVPLAKASLGPNLANGGGGVKAVAFDAAGDLVITDDSLEEAYLVSNRNCSQSCPYGFSSLRKGYVYLLAGGGSIPASTSGVTATQAQLAYALPAIAIDTRQDVLIADTGNGVVTLLAASGCSSSCPFGLSSMTAGHMYPVAGDGTTTGSTVSGSSATSQSIGDVDGVALDQQGNLVLTANTSTNPHVVVVAGNNCSANCPYGVGSLSTGDLYALSTATYPRNVAVDAVGDVLYIDETATEMLAQNNCSADCPYGLHAMSANGLYQIASSISYPGSLAFTNDGNLLVGSSASTDATVYKVAGGAASFQLSVGGTGTVSGGGTTCHTNCTAIHAAGSQMQVTATPGTGKLFAGWMTAPCKGVGTCTATISQDGSVKAAFRTRKALARRVGGVLRRIRGRNLTPSMIWQHKGYRVGFRSAAARKLVIAWRVHVNKRNVVVAIGRRTPARVGVLTHLKIKLTKAGRRLLSATTSMPATEIARLHLGPHHQPIKRTRRITI